MQTHYQHLIKIEPLKEHLDELGIVEEHLEELIDIAYKTIHIEVVNYILTHLDEEHHEEIIKYLEEKPQDKGVWVFLKQSIQDLEQNLEKVIQNVINDLVYEVSEYKQTSKEWFTM